MPKTMWTPKNADLPEFSVLALRKNIEAVTGLKLKPVLSPKTGHLTLKGTIPSKSESRDAVELSLRKLGKVKVLKLRKTTTQYIRGMNRRVVIKDDRGNPKYVDKNVVYVPKAEATASINFVGGQDGHYELWIS